MIQANELRIGNWVNGASRGLPEKVTAALLNGIEKGNVVVIPIPLTPEILEKARFTQDRNGFLLKNLSFSVTSNGEFLACWQDRQIGKIVKYLHQLQNLYFALTGEELQIEL